METETRICDLETYATLQIDRIDTIIERLSRLEERMATSAISSSNFMKRSMSKSNCFSNIMAERVTSIDGIKEANEASTLAARATWTALVIIGALLTSFYVYLAVKDFMDNRTAVQVELDNTCAEYPPLQICPFTWLDERKASTAGLSEVGLNYSLGYLNVLQSSTSEEFDAETGSADFRRFYDASNYSCLYDYFRSVSQDCYVDNSLEWTDERRLGFHSHLIDRSTPLERLIIDGALCYQFRFAATPVRSTALTSMVVETFDNRTLPRLLPRKDYFEMYVNANPGLVTQVAPSIPLALDRITVVYISRQQFSRLSKPDDPCDDADDYSEDECVKRCVSELESRDELDRRRTGRSADQAFRCYIFGGGYDALHASQYCNAADMPANRSLSVAASGGGDDDSSWRNGSSSLVVTGNEFEEGCRKSCPAACSTVAYSISYSSKPLDIQLFQDGRIGAVVQVVDAAMSAGNVRFQEIWMYTFVDLVGIVGGVLGVFIGCTAMTFVQLSVALVEYTMAFFSALFKQPVSPCKS